MNHPYPSQEITNPSVLALRRTLWQLAFVGVGSAFVIAAQAPVLALWCALTPLSALAAHYRHELAGWLRDRRRAAAVSPDEIRGSRSLAQARRSSPGSAAVAWYRKPPLRPSRSAARARRLLTH